MAAEVRGDQLLEPAVIWANEEAVEQSGHLRDKKNKQTEPWLLVVFSREAAQERTLNNQRNTLRRKAKQNMGTRRSSREKKDQCN